jgi:hypothetical protein
MARLRQQHPQNYISSGNINTEFESVIRYLNAAEIGNKTIAELLKILFDENGEFAGPVELRLDAANGLQYRVGTYDTEDKGWITIASLAEIRGPAGQNLGAIEGPLFFNRRDIVATEGQTVVPYAFDESTQTVVVYVNGVLQREAAYTADALNGEIVMAEPLSDGQIVTVYSVRTQSVSNFRRSDQEATVNQAVFAFAHTPDDRLLVFRNGILQREGGANDYTANPDTDTITFVTPLSPGDVVTIITAENLALRRVAGLMLEEQYTDGNGLIDWSKIAVDDGEIPQAKVADLVAALASKAKITVSATTPIDGAQGDLWLDVSQSPISLKYFDGSVWRLTSPESTLPSFGESNANQYVRVNGTGTALELGNIDFSALVPKTFMGAANGVASLDSSGRLPVTQLPDIFSSDTINVQQTGSVTNGTILAKRIYKQRIRLDGITRKLGAGTCTVQVSVDGVALGSEYAVTTTPQDSDFGAVIEIDGTTVSKRLEIVITNASSASDLEIGLAAANLSV